jgi:glycogen debranching enzyme
MTNSDVGTCRGYDELFQHRVDLVTETKFYSFLSEDSPVGMTAARKFLNELHDRMVREGYNEQHVHRDEDVIVIQVC